MHIRLTFSPLLEKTVKIEKSLVLAVGLLSLRVDTSTCLVNPSLPADKKLHLLGLKNSPLLGGGGGCLKISEIYVTTSVWYVGHFPCMC